MKPTPQEAIPVLSSPYMKEIWVTRSYFGGPDSPHVAIAAEVTNHPVRAFKFEQSGGMVCV